MSGAGGWGRLSEKGGHAVQTRYALIVAWYSQCLSHTTHRKSDWNPENARTTARTTAAGRSSSGHRLALGRSRSAARAAKSFLSPALLISPDYTSTHPFRAADVIHLCPPLFFFCFFPLFPLWQRAERSRISTDKNRFLKRLSYSFYCRGMWCRLNQ